ncbi:MAG: hypothetical protein JWR80_10047 [Bradyrhizobium sp.]|nr:hypothetical protein [Bradyrhizobium sp.]
MTRLLVCGGREYGEIPNGCPPDQVAAYRLAAGRAIFILRETLDHLHAERRFTDLVNGAAKGADRHAVRWALPRGLTINSFGPDWRKHGKAAGPIRNQQMVDIGKPDLVVAFPGGDGTADMVRRAKAANIEVIEL